MKIGILTFHFGNNYGGILQCYALQQILKSLDHDVEIINFVPSNVSLIKRITDKVRTIKSFSALFKLLLDFIQIYKYKHSNSISTIENKRRILTIFNQFRSDFLNLSQPLNEINIGEYTLKYDLIVVGSDQVWTSLYDKNPIYFLDWIPKFKGRKIGYAVCSAHEHVRKSRLKYLKKQLEDFDDIFVRDITTAKLVEYVTGNQPSVVADPTLLYHFKEFITENTIKEPYILTYILGGEIKGGHDIAIQKIRKQYGNIKIVSISISGQSNDLEKYSDINYYDLSPNNWVNLFFHSTFIYTDSFHGVIFSLKFKKKFVAYYVNLIRSSRLIDLKERFNLKNNIINSTDKLSIENIVNSEMDNFLLDKCIQKSINCISKI